VRGRVVGKCEVVKPGVGLGIDIYARDCGVIHAVTNGSFYATKEERGEFFLSLGYEARFRLGNPHRAGKPCLHEGQDFFYTEYD